MYPLSEPTSDYGCCRTWRATMTLSERPTIPLDAAL